MPTLDDFPNHVGAPPNFDGDINWYFYDRDSLNTKANVVYVNGMQTPTAAHMLVALLLSQAIDRPITGVYNLMGFSKFFLYPGTEAFDALMEHREQTDTGWRLTMDDALRWTNDKVGFLADVVQCITDKEAGYIPGRKIGAAFGFTFEVKPRMTPEQSIAELCGHNRATLALLTFLRNATGRTTIVCHSQGNIITANAVYALSVLGHRVEDGWVRVLSLASPVTFWPPGVWVRKFAFSNDPITYLSLGGSYVGDHEKASYGDGKVGLAAHDAGNYLGKFGAELKTIIDGA
jgi:hypothetical protein